MREKHSSQGSSMCKGPEVGLGLGGWRQVFLTCSEGHKAGRVDGNRECNLGWQGVWVSP